MLLLKTRLILYVVFFIVDKLKKCRPQVNSLVKINYFYKGNATKTRLNVDRSVSEKVESTNLNMPPFFDDPRIWFGKVEALFRTREINEEVQMHAYLVQILSKLAIVISENAQELINEMPKSKPYKKLEKAILEGCEQFL